MSADADDDLEQLATDVLALYTRAAELGQLQVAEQLLQALEEIAKTTCACVPTRDEAYLRIAFSQRESGC